MKEKLILMAIILSGSLLSCNNASDASSEKTNKDMGEIIGKANPTVENGIMSPEVLHSFGRVGDVDVSPDKS